MKALTWEANSIFLVKDGRNIYFKDLSQEPVGKAFDFCFTDYNGVQNANFKRISYGLYFRTNFTKKFNKKLAINIGFKKL